MPPRLALSDYFCNCTSSSLEAQKCFTSFCLPVILDFPSRWNLRLWSSIEKKRDEFGSGVARLPGWRGAVYFSSSLYPSASNRQHSTPPFPWGSSATLPPEEPSRHSPASWLWGMSCRSNEKPATYWWSSCFFIFGDKRKIKVVLWLNRANRKRRDVVGTTYNNYICILPKQLSLLTMVETRCDIFPLEIIARRA